MTSNNPDITSAQHQRMRDTLKLAQSRMQNIEENLKRLRSLQDKLYRHQQLNSELDINSRELFILTKESASLSEEATEMDRFETFESIMAPFLRMQLLEAEAEENRRTGAELEQEIREISNKIEEQRKLFSHSQDNTKIVEAQHQDTCHLVEESSQMDGACQVLQETIKRANYILVSEEDRLDSLQSQLSNVTRVIEDLEKSLENLTSKRHTLESHEAMLEHIDSVLSMLYRLEEMAESMNRKGMQYNKNIDEQRRVDETLSQIKTQHTDIKQQIESLQDDIEIHRNNIRGVQSYQVQERVIKLKTHLLMLSAAQSLWRRISTGYASITEKTQLINSLRLEIEHDLKAEQELTIYVNSLKRQVADKEYSLNMSKSQSLISLRDLREGTACSVCGATHHPYHSDTMQDQYKLISDFKSDYETLSGELQGQERQLSILHDKLTQNLGQQIAEQHNLETIRLRQSEDVKEWRIFAHLDPTFIDCSDSTDSDSRMATIRQLMDNTQRDLQSAEADLGEFNYHSNQIRNLSEKLSILEKKEAEIAMRMNETISLSRILASEGEKMENSHKLAQDKYHRHYELLQKDITLPEWFKLWEVSAESLYIQLRQMASDWVDINKNISTIAHQLSETKLKKEMLETMQKQCSQNIDVLKEELRLQNNKYNETYEHRQTLLPHVSTGEALSTSLNTLHQAHQEYFTSMNTLQEMTLKQKELEGAYHNARSIGETLDQKTSAQRNLVDLWIRSYNASHPPVQYSELNAVLTQNIDWNEKRQRIRDNRLATSLQQQKVKALQSEIIALEIDTGSLTQSQLNEKQINTDSQIEQQEAQLRDVTLQIAKLKIELGI